MKKSASNNLVKVALIIAAIVSSARIGAEVQNALTKSERAPPIHEFTESGGKGASPYQLSVEGGRLAIVRATHVAHSYYTRFQFESPFVMDVSVDVPAGSRIKILPERYDKDLGQQTDGQYKLTINEPGVRVLALISEKGEVSSPAYIMAESPIQATAAGERMTFDVSSLASKDARQPATSALQEVLNRAGRSENGALVYFGPGEYHIGNVVVGKNTELHLAPGARIIARPILDDYRYPDQMVLLLFNDADNSGISGRGVIDGNGDVIQGIKPERTSIHLVRFLNSQNVFVRDVLLRNSVTWTLHILGCNNVLVEGIRILGDRSLRNVDGIDPDNSSNVTISSVFVSAGDDAISVKTSRRYRSKGPSESVKIANSTLMTPKVAVRLGGESLDPINDVLVENVDIVFSGRGLAGLLFDGSEFSGLTYRNIRMTLFEEVGEKFSGEPFRFLIGNRKNRGEGRMQGLLFQDISVTAPYRAIFSGTEESLIKNLTLRNIQWRLTPTNLKKRRLTRLDRFNKNRLPINGRPLIQAHWLDGAQLEELTIDWTQAEENWGRLFDIQNSKSVRKEGIRSIGAPLSD